MICASVSWMVAWENRASGAAKPELEATDETFFINLDDRWPSRTVGRVSTRRTISRLMVDIPLVNLVLIQSGVQTISRGCLSWVDIWTSIPSPEKLESLSSSLNFSASLGR